MGVVAEMSLSAGWLSVDCGVGGLCPRGLGLRSRWALPTQVKRKGHGRHHGVDMVSDT